jgi:hypothetical protein
MHTGIYVSCEIWTHDPSVRAGENGSGPRPRGHRDRLIRALPLVNCLSSDIQANLHIKVLLLLNMPTLVEYWLLGYNVVWSVESHSSFRRNISSPSSGSKNKTSKKRAWATCFHVGFLLRLPFYPEDEDDIFLRNVSWHWTDYTALYPRKCYSS